VPPESSGPQDTNKPSSEDAGRRAIFEQGHDGRAAARERQPASEAPDLTLDVPSLGVEELNLDVENLRARVSLHAELADMVKLSVGVEADVDKVKLEAKGVEAQLLLKAGLDNVRAILAQALDALDNNPGILEDLLQTSGQPSGQPSGETTGETSGSGDSARALEGAAGPVDDPPEQGEGGGTGEPEPEDEVAGVPEATDAARRKAEELGVDLSRVEGSGDGGRILLRDVKGAANG
jgi:pyruvate/2-oxoglutarate dehydrogenase complex dihydrolipoamide acyltransferase (E2) component